MATMRNESPRRDRAAIERAAHKRHLRHRLVGDVAKVHQRPCGKSHLFESRLQFSICVQFSWRLRARNAEIGSVEDHTRHAVVDHGYVDTGDPVDRMAAWKQRTAGGT